MPIILSQPSRESVPVRSSVEPARSRPVGVSHGRFKAGTGFDVLTLVQLSGGAGHVATVRLADAFRVYLPSDRPPVTAE